MIAIRASCGCRSCHWFARMRWDGQAGGRERRDSCRSRLEAARGVRGVLLEAIEAFALVAAAASSSIDIAAFALGSIGLQLFKSPRKRANDRNFFRRWLHFETGSHRDSVCGNNHEQEQHYQRHVATGFNSYPHQSWF